MFNASCNSENRVSNIFGDVETGFNHLFDPAGKQKAAGFHPSWDIAEYDDSFRLNLELPGVNPDQVEVGFEDGILTVSGEKSIDRSEEGVNFHRAERQ